MKFALHVSLRNTLHMATNLAIDDKLDEEARKTGGHKIKKEAVTQALEEYIRHHKQQRSLRISAPSISTALTITKRRDGESATDGIGGYASLVAIPPPPRSGPAAS